MYPYKQVKRNGRHQDEHRYLMEQKLGRKLSRQEFVHHINGDKRDNRLENLLVVSPKQHAIEHRQQKHPISKPCEVCGETFTPHPTKRATKKTCSERCRGILSSLMQRNPSAPNSMYRPNAYPCQVALRK